MEQIRSFIAIELPPEVKAGLDSLEGRLKAGQHPFVKWVDP
ncbi:MAG: RNA 2',3'-cyclic phosphodiesterase, partial [Dehalococcoidia bacterium]